MDQARIGWWEGEQFRIAAARLRNISNGGAALTVACDAPVAPPVWLSVVMPGPSDWILARVAGVCESGDGDRCIRLSFVEPCPSAVFQAAVGGTSAAPGSRTTAETAARPATPEVAPRTRRRRRDAPCRHGAWGGPSIPPLGGEEMKKWSGLFEYLRYF